MNFAPLTILALLLWTGICAADQRVLGARQFHQPIVAAAGVGILLHAPERALLVGLWFQLVWVAPMPIGGVLLPDTGSAAAAAALTAVIIPGPLGLGAALLVGFLLGSISIPWERALRSGNAVREAAALDQIVAHAATAADGSQRTDHDRPGGGVDHGGRRASSSLGWAVLRGAAGPFLRGVLSAGIAILLAPLLLLLLPPHDPASFPGPAKPSDIDSAFLGGAACFGLAGLFLRLKPEAGRSGALWAIGGVLIGLAGGILMTGGGSR